MIILRPYQRAALDGLYAWFQRHPEGNPLVAAAVGAGKSVMIAALCQEAIQQWPETRIVMCVPSLELCQQNLDKLLTIWPEAPASVYSAAMGRKELGTAIVYATIGSIYKIAHQLGRVDLLLIDEVHLLGDKETGMFRKLINDLSGYCPDLRCVGWTGTAFRGNGIYLTDQEAPLFHGTAASVTMRHLLDTGYLAPLTTQATATKIATDGVGMRSGDYIVSQLAAASDQAHLVASACQEIVALAAERKRWLVFAVTVEHAKHIQQSLSGLGIACAVVSGVTPKAERAQHIADFRSGQLRALVSVACLTTGFDVPEVDCIALLRATRSPVLYCQILGRGMRIAPDKSDCIASGQLVLTDIGLVPIEHITIHMKVWDGDEFVSHDGVIFRGIQNVITYAGLTATPDHKVWTKEGWRTLSECKERKDKICCTEYGGKAIREADRIFTRGNQKGSQSTRIYTNIMRHLWNCIRERFTECFEKRCWMSNMCCISSGSGLVDAKMQFCKVQMRESKRCGISSIRDAWNRIQVSKSIRYGNVGNWQFGNRQSKTNRQDKQRWSLRNGEFEACNTASQSMQHEGFQSDCFNAQVSNDVSRSKICGCNNCESIKKEDVFRANKREVLQEITQTKRHVWDILNSGPRNRFTVSGLLVHNCLVLDFTDTVATLGPVDAIKGRAKPLTKGSATAPFKVCPECGSHNATALLVCLDCGFEFPPPERINHGVFASNAAVLSSQLTAKVVRYPVDKVTYHCHVKPGSPDSLRVEYWSGLRVVAKEWVCFAHPGFAGEKARQWWLKRVAQTDDDLTRPPAATIRALELLVGYEPFERAPLSTVVPAFIHVNEYGKYPEIIRFEWETTA